jgi:hypothetical protein
VLKVTIASFYIPLPSSDSCPGNIRTMISSRPTRSRPETPSTWSRAPPRPLREPPPPERRPHVSRRCIQARTFTTRLRSSMGIRRSELWLALTPSPIWVSIRTTQTWYAPFFPFPVLYFDLFFNIHLQLLDHLQNFTSRIRTDVTNDY